MTNENHEKPINKPMNDSINATTKAIIEGLIILFKLIQY